nr:apocytochrome B, mitochondrial [Tanacetum cinerariifolium]
SSPGSLSSVDPVSESEEDPGSNSDDEYTSEEYDSEQEAIRLAELDESIPLHEEIERRAEELSERLESLRENLDTLREERAYLVEDDTSSVTLAMHYNPSVAEAFNSVEHIMRDVNNG